MCSVQACGVQHLMRAVLAVFSCTALFAWGCTALGYDGRCVGPRSQHRHLTVSGHLPYDSTVRDSTNRGESSGSTSPIEARGCAASRLAGYSILCGPSSQSLAVQRFSRGAARPSDTMVDA